MKNIQERNNQNPFLEGKLIFPAHLNQSEREGFFMIKWQKKDVSYLGPRYGLSSNRFLFLKKSGMTGPARQWNALIS